MPLSSLPAWIAAVVAAVAMAPAWARATLPAAAEMLRDAIGAAGRGAVDDFDLSALFVPDLVLPTVVVITVSGSVGLAVRALLDGVAWRSARIAPSLHRIDPLAGLARIFSARTVVAVLGNAAALVAVVAAAAWSLGPLVVGGNAAVRGIDLAADPVPLVARGQTVLLPLAAVATGIAAVQWALARWRFERRIRMTPEEFQEEARSLQADPKIKLMREQSRRPRQPVSAPAPGSHTGR